MARMFFEVTNYACELYNEVPRTVQNLNIFYNSIIKVFGSRKRIYIYFVTEASPLPKPSISSSGFAGEFFVRASRQAEFIDLLRNEKPIFADLHTGEREVYCNIRTAYEPTGEEENG